MLTNLQSFLRHEATAGVLVMIAAAAALLIDNSPLTAAYDAFFHTRVLVQIGTFALDKTVLLVINDGLMAVFFLLVGLEIKREILAGELSSRETALLPLIAALGGMAAPGLIYAAINAGDPVALRGWAIPAATDIAFAVGVISMLGSRVPASLKVFLLALAIIDDLGAIIIIALFYTSDLSLAALAAAGAGVIGLVALNRAGVTRIAPYILVGAFIWLFVLKSGVHATLAGVIVALAIPMTPENEEQCSLRRLEHMLHPWVAYGILPAFAFANAGVSLSGVSLASLAEPIPLGIMLGLVVGKTLGIAGASWIAIRLGWCRMPDGANWTQMLGLSMLGGIGFTMSLFIGMLAFPDPSYAASIRIGVLSGSVLAAIAGSAVLIAASRSRAAVSPA
ncbi:MAG TPA: Na+/H+ antiporter NhaA [Hyphomicrobiaceae bacterium]|nr:Na+/H+ antiporter NhaA [Hyphomicrobiaceae bacterium]